MGNIRRIAQPGPVEFAAVTGMIGDSGYEYFPRRIAVPVDRNRSDVSRPASPICDVQLCVAFFVWDLPMKTVHPDYDRTIDRVSAKPANVPTAFPTDED